MPQDLRLYVGTALALYLHHPTSTDFAIATPDGLVDLQLVKTVDAFAGPVTVTGGDGMVDLVLHAGRDVKVTLMECGNFVPRPVLPPRRARNGVDVADPVDTVCAELVAAAQRDMARDFVDLAAAERRWPGILEHGLDAARQSTRHPRAALIASLLDPPPRAARELDDRTRADLAGQLRTVDRVRSWMHGTRRVSGSGTLDEGRPRERRASPRDDAAVFLSTRKAAALLTLSPRTLDPYREIGTGPPYFRLGQRIVYAREDLLDWAWSKRVNPES